MPPFHALIVRTEVLTSQWVVHRLKVQAYKHCKAIMGGCDTEKRSEKGKEKTQTQQKREKQKVEKIIRVSWQLGCIIEGSGPSPPSLTGQTWPPVMGEDLTACKSLAPDL